MIGEHSWRKSSRSQNGANCVEVMGTLDQVRDSKNTTTSLCCDVSALVQAVRYGLLDR
ncbi:MAG TPA: DUF397 domain-containing protein [Actinophytocola sp.]|uniref:DUF397 domain-containing protein n=1 Tax=Actinophytocola sp. TaxID=1872138 RepID=UPI002DF7A282|nr:DUF397 domain-containing protein [Actinophytocola sp.]